MRFSMYPFAISFAHNVYAASGKPPIEESLALQRNLFFLSASDQTQEPEFNPLYTKLFPSLFRLEQTQITWTLHQFSRLVPQQWIGVRTNDVVKVFSVPNRPGDGYFLSNLGHTSNTWFAKSLKCEDIY
jgi:hypothetical protein